MAGTPQVGVKAVIENYDQFIAGLKQMQQAVVTLGETTESAAQPMQQMGMSADQLVSKLAGLGIVRKVYGDFKDFFVQGIQTSMAVERMSIGTENLARTLGETGDEMVRAIQQASGGTIGGLAAMQAANQATIMGVVQNKEEMADLTRIAVGLGRAMGKNAVSSLDDMTIALGRNSPRILDNLGLIVKEGQAHEAYAKQIGTTVDKLTDEQKAYAFRQAALEKGREVLKNIGDSSGTTATKVEQLNTKWGEFRTTMGKLALDVVGNDFKELTWLIDRLNEGARAWIQLIEKDLPALEKHRQAVNETAVNTAFLSKNEKELGDAVYNSLISQGLEKTQQALVKSSGSLAAYQRAVDAYAKRPDPFIPSQALQLLPEEYAKLLPLSEDFNDVMLKTGVNASYTEAQIRNLASGMAVLGNTTLAYVQAQQGYTMPEGWLTANISTMIWWRGEQERVYDDIGKASLQWAKDVEKGLDKSRDAMADYITGVMDMQERLAESGANAGREYADAMKDKDKSVEDAFESHNEKLQSIAQERAEKIAWVMSGAHARTKEENDKALGYWNAFYDAELRKVEESYIEQNTAINDRLRERQAAIAEQQAKERKAVEDQRRDMALQASLSMVEGTGQLERLTGITGATAQEVMGLIKGGIIPLQGDLLTAVSNAWGTINTTMQNTEGTAKANQQAQIDLFNTMGTQADSTKTKLEEQKTPLQQMNSDLNDLQIVINNLGTDTPPAMDMVKESLDMIKKPAEDATKAVADIGLKGAAAIEEVDWQGTGTKSVEGYMAGITLKLPDVYNLGRQTYQEYDRGIRDAGQIKSPSLAAMELGDYTGQGFIIGLNNALEKLPSESSDLLYGWFKDWWHVIRGGLRQFGYQEETFKEQLKAALESITVAPGESYAEVADRVLEDVIGRMPEHLRAKFIPAMEYLRSQFGRVLEAMGTDINQFIVDPLDPLLSMGSTLSGAANTFIRLMQAQQATAAPSANQLAYFDALRQGSLDLLRINQQLNDERATGLGLEQQMADLQSLQGQLELLQAEKSLVDMIREYGLSYQEILGSITLGTDTSLEMLTQASIRALTAIVSQANTAYANLPETQPLPFIAPSPPVPEWEPVHDIPGPILPEQPTTGGGAPNQGYYSGGSGGIYLGPVGAQSLTRAGGVSVNFTGAVTITSPMDLATVGAYIKQVVAEAVT